MAVRILDDFLIDGGSPAVRRKVVRQSAAPAEGDPRADARGPDAVAANRSAQFAPQPARSLGRPGLWVSNNDYPAGALRRGEQGVTGLSVIVGPDGRCTVTRASGSAELDQTTCAKVSARARFAPATDGSGDAVAGRYGNAIRWEIPNQ